LEHDQESVMSTNPDDLLESARTASDVGSFVEHAAHAAGGASSRVGRIAAAVSGIKLGAKLLPAAMRAMKRYPVMSALALAGVVWAAYSMRSAQKSPRT
jgi:hypothetical protein